MLFILKRAFQYAKFKKFFATRVENKQCVTIVLTNLAFEELKVSFNKNKKSVKDLTDTATSWLPQVCRY